VKVQTLPYIEQGSTHRKTATPDLPRPIDGRRIPLFDEGEAPAWPVYSIMMQNSSPLFCKKV